MSEYIVAGAEPNNTVLKSITKNGYEHEMWLPVREEIVRCRDCEHSRETESGALYCIGYLTEPWDYYNDEPSQGRKVTPDGFCAWAERKVDA